MSNVRKFLFTCAGADTELLQREECSTDRIKYASIGALIVLTATFAFISGSYALYRVFVGGMSLAGPWDYSYAIFMTLVAMGLGVVWALFIFNFDRVVVISIDKRWSWQKQIGMAIPRLLAALFISIVVAAPLEVLIFSDRIADQIEKMQAEKRQQRFESLESGFGLNSTRQRVQSADQEVDSLASLAQSETPNTPRYRNLESQFRQCEDSLRAVRKRNNRSIDRQRSIIRQRVNERSSIQRDINRKADSIDVLEKRAENTQESLGEGSLSQRVERMQSNIEQLANQRAELNSDIADVQSRIDRLKKAIQEQKNTCTALRQKIRNEVRQFRNEVSRKRDSLEAVRAERDSILKTKRSRVSQEKTEAGSALEQSYSGNFVTQLEAMWALVEEDDSGTLFWVNTFLMGLFFFIEVGPVLIKLFADEGAYEKLEARKSRIMEETKEVEEETGKELVAKKAELRKQTELDLYKSVLEEAKEVKEAVAIQRLRDILNSEINGDIGEVSSSEMSEVKAALGSGDTPTNRSDHKTEQGL